MKNLSFITALAIAFAPLAGSAQDVPFTCSAHGLEHLAPFLQGHPERVQEIEQADQHLEQVTQQFMTHFDARGGNAYVIPVVFHIIHNNGPENITDDQVIDAVRILNEDYNKLNPDWDQVKEEFMPIVANVGITFRLAGLDPDGNCTSGITRTVSDLTNDGTQTMKDLIDWPRDRYLNVWVAASAAGAAGYTQTPGSVDGFWGEAADGIVILHNYVGSIGTSVASHSRALTHEVGHWINLKHCWGGTNTPGDPGNCDIDDNVSDTPNTIGWQSCNRNGATCGSALDNVENYMEYSYCSKMFTNGQKARMTASLNNNTANRDNLWTDGNLAATGTADPQPLCIAAFSSDARVICAGAQIGFHDHSYHGITFWQWNFTGGDPATSADAAPLVTYTTPGVYPVELTVSNGQSSLMAQETAYITVLPSTGTPSPYQEPFENMVSTLDPTQWTADNPDGDAGTFSLRTNAGYSGTHSVRMKNQGISAGLVDELLGPTVDLSQDSSVVLTFRYAFARRTSTDDDALRVYVSKDCGYTWTLRKQLKGSTDLPTVTDQNAAFTPSGPEQWQQCTITNITSSYLVSDFRFKFWFKGDGGNDLWLDDINLEDASTVGVYELSSSNAIGIQVLPNPATTAATVIAYLPNSGAAHVELLDPTGRIVNVISDGNLSVGTHRWALPVERLRSGMYLVRLRQDGLQRVVRFTKE